MPAWQQNKTGTVLSCATVKVWCVCICLCFVLCETFYKNNAGIFSKLNVLLLLSMSSIVIHRIIMGKG